MKKNTRFLNFLLTFSLIITMYGGIFIGTKAAEYTKNEDGGATPASEIDFASDFIDRQNEKSEGVVQVSSDRYFTDAENYKVPPSVTPGSFRDSQVVYDEKPAYTVQDENGNTTEKAVDNFTVTFKATESLNTSIWADRFLSDHTEIQLSREEVAALVIDGGHPQKYEQQFTSEYEVKVQIREVTVVNEFGQEETKWKAYYSFPEDFPTDLTLAMTEIEVDGMIYEIKNFEQVYLAGMEGDPEDEDPDPEDPEPEDPEPEDPEPEPDPETGYSWAYVTNGITSYQHLTPSRNGSISHPEDKYDVSTAIPTSENLKFSASADDSLYDIGVRTYTGKAGVEDVEVVATATYTYYYDETYVKEDGYYVTNEETGEEEWVDPVYDTRTIKATGYTSHVVDSSYTTSITETYYDVPISNIYPVKTASFTGAPVNATVSLTGGPTAGAKTTTVTATHPGIGSTYYYSMGHYSNYDNARAAVEGGESSAKSGLIGVLYNSINQYGYFNYSYRGLNVTPTTNNGTKPSVVSTSNSTIQMIPSNKSNGNYATSGTVSYSNGQSFAFGVNDVFVHTPVVNKAEISKTSPFINQKIVTDPNVKYLMLDEEFTVKIPNEGVHRNTKGYSLGGLERIYNMYQAVTRLASNWGKIKDVKLPFDAYLHKSDGTKVFVKAGTWLNNLGLATNQNEYTFTIPVWAKEGPGTIETRVIAENAIWFSPLIEHDGTKMEEDANLNPDNYIATKTIEVEVIGKIYDLRISGTNDPGWTDIKGKEGAYITAAEFPFGQSGQNKLSAYKFAPKLGYTVEFDFKTKGIKTDNVDVSIQPEGFYFVGKNGGTAEEVDLYYKTVANKYVKIQTGTANTSIIVNLANKFMKVATSEILDSQRIMKKTIEVAYTYTENVNIGSMPKLNLPEKLRLCYDNFEEYVDKLYKKNKAGIIADAAGRFEYTDKGYKKVTNGQDTVIASVGHWYAGYRLPSSTIAVPKGTTPAQILANSNIIKKDGYILVKFDIVGKSGEEEYLRYTGPESINEETKDNTGEYVKDEDGNEMKWQDPSGNNDPTSPTQDIDLPNGKPAIVPDGAAIIFDADLRANNDYESEGTH